MKAALLIALLVAAAGPIGLFIPVLAASAVAPGTYAVADNMGVTVKRVNGLLPCGLTLTVGCFSAAAPNAIYIQAGMGTYEEAFTVMHELKHVQQHREGRTLDECEADAFGKRYVPHMVGAYRC